MKMKKMMLFLSILGLSLTNSTSLFGNICCYNSNVDPYEYEWKEGDKCPGDGDWKPAPPASCSDLGE
jgi:hypothetical protein